MAASINLAHPATFLRRAVQFDGMVISLFGLAFLIGNSFFSQQFQLPTWVMLLGGAGLAIEGVIFWVLAERPKLSKLMAQLALANNLGWIAFIAIVFLAGWAPASFIASFILVDVALVCIGFAIAQIVGLRRLEALG
jgi:hypothetical protein